MNFDWQFTALVREWLARSLLHAKMRITVAIAMWQH